jgi:hypothetical protein
MPDFENFHWKKYFFFLAMALMGAIGTQAKDVIDHHPVIALCCAVTASFTTGFFSENKK